MKSWYLAKIKLQKETFLTSYLSQGGVEVFFPKIIEPSPYGRSLKALFPTYLFCRLDPDSSIWPTVRGAPGIAYFLSSDGMPSRIPGDLVDTLRERVNRWNDPTHSRHLDQGDKVVVTGGPFAGLEGIFQRYISSKRRCRILLEVVGRLTNVELPGWEVKEVSAMAVRP
jgi:transcription antitermination factor NusG